MLYQKPLSYVIEESSFGVGAQGVHVVYSGVGINTHVYRIFRGCVSTAGRRVFLRKVGDAAPTLCVQFNGEFIGGRRGVVAEFDSLSFGDQLDICMDFEAMCKR